MKPQLKPVNLNESTPAFCFLFHDYICQLVESTGAKRLYVDHVFPAYRCANMNLGHLILNAAIEKATGKALLRHNAKSEQNETDVDYVHEMLLRVNELYHQLADSINAASNLVPCAELTLFVELANKMVLQFDNFKARTDMSQELFAQYINARHTLTKSYAWKTK